MSASRLFASASAATLMAGMVAGCASLPENVAQAAPVAAPTVAAAVATTVASTVRTTAAANDALILQQRLAAAQTATITDMNAYSPVEPIAGCTVPAPLPAPLPPGASPSPQLAQALLAAKAYSDSQQGRGLIVMLNGQLIHESYAPGITAQTPFVSQSLHKSLLALAMLAAVEDGIIGSLDDPLGHYIAAWADDPRGAVTLRQAMQMTSGLELFSMAGGDGRALAMNFGTDLETAALSSPLSDAPGTVFAYNNANAQIVGTALANALQAAGKGRYADYLQARIWCPLGNGPAALRLDRAGGAPQYFAGVHAALRDWAKIGESIRTGTIGPANIDLDALARPSLINPNYGLFMWLGSPADGQRRYSAGNPLFIRHSAPYVDEDMLFMDGFGGQRVYIAPSSGLVIARFGEVSFTYDDAIIPNLIAGGLAPAD